MLQSFHKKLFESSEDVTALTGTDLEGSSRFVPCHELGRCPSSHRCFLSECSIAEGLPLSSKNTKTHPEITYACIQFIKYCLEKQLICKVISYAKITYTQMLNKMSQISFSLRWLEVALSQSEHRSVSKGRKGQMWSRCFPRMISQPICIQEYIFPIQNQHTWLKKWVVIF